MTVKCYKRKMKKDCIGVSQEFFSPWFFLPHVNKEKRFWRESVGLQYKKSCVAKTCYKLPLGRKSYHLFWTFVEPKKLKTGGGRIQCIDSFREREGVVGGLGKELLRAKIMKIIPSQFRIGFG